MHHFKPIVAATLLALASARPMREDRGHGESDATIDIWKKRVVKGLATEHEPLELTPSSLDVQGSYQIRVWDDDKKFIAELGVTRNPNNPLDQATYAQVKPGVSGMNYFYSHKSGGYNHLMVGLEDDWAEDQVLLYPVIDITYSTQGTAPVKFDLHPVSRMGPPRLLVPGARVTYTIDSGYIFDEDFGKIFSNPEDGKFIPVYHPTSSGHHAFALCADNEGSNTMLHFVLSGTAEEHGCKAVNIELRFN